LPKITHEGYYYPSVYPVTARTICGLPEKRTRALVANGALLCEVLTPSRFITSALQVGYDFGKRSSWPKKFNPDNPAFICEYFKSTPKMPHI
jgi:hypothetical protein